MQIDVLIPTFERPAALAVTLTGLSFQTHADFRVVISDQSESRSIDTVPEVRAAARVAWEHGHEVTFLRNLPRRGLAHQRQFLLERANAPACLFLDDDVLLEPFVLAMMARVLEDEHCGFVGNAVIGLSYVHDVRPAQQQCELWEGPVCPERVLPDTPQWARHRLHNAANLYHVQRRLGAAPDRPRRYKVAWVGGCVLYDTDRLRAAGGFDFWRDLPPTHCGEDVLAQLNVMARFGGCGVMPSGAWHQELPTTVHDRRIDAPRILGGRDGVHSH